MLSFYQVALKRCNSQLGTTGNKSVEPTTLKQVAKYQDVEQEVRTHPDNKLLKWQCCKSAAGLLLQAVRLYEGR